ncbi:MAG: GNAT family N-acetyltransferase [Treponema sp.]|jgi:GNAT superfamily N-acetyltransferase|nr:GNAT family N-acetyltransferase [Treponema sp.]
MTWYTLEKDELQALVLPIEAFLQEKESSCVAACARFLQRDVQDPIWLQITGEERISGLIMLSKGILFPVFKGIPAVSLEDFQVHGLRAIRFYAIHGIRHHVALLEQAFAVEGVFPAHSVDYDLMVLDQEPGQLHSCLEGLSFRYPKPADHEALFHLQAAYEQEEVLPPGGVFNPAACRMSLERIIAHEHLLLAQWKSQIVGKINTNAASFSRYQIGGVYVHPDYRGVGIASAMGTAFVRDLLSTGRGLTLFVKKQNHTARKVYLRIGFRVLEDYRISYYG